MGYKKISELQKLNLASSGDQLVMIDAGVTKNANLDNFSNSIDTLYYKTHTIDGSTSNAHRIQDENNDYYGKFRLVSGNFFVSGNCVGQGDNSVFRVQVGEIDINSPSRSRLTKTGNFSLGGSLHVSGDNQKLSGYGIVSQAPAWLQHQVKIDSEVTGAGKFNFTSTTSSQFTAVPTVISPGGSYDSVALSGNVVATGLKISGDLKAVRDNVFAKYNANSLEKTGVRRNRALIEGFSGLFDVTGRNLQDQINAGLTDTLRATGITLSGNDITLGNYLNTTGKFLINHISGLTGRLDATGVYLRTAVATQDAFRMNQRTTGLFPPLSWNIPNVDHAFSYGKYVTFTNILHYEATASRRRLGQLRFSDANFTGLNDAHASASWTELPNDQGNWQIYSSPICTKIKGSTTKKYYQLLYCEGNQKHYQFHLGANTSTDFGSTDNFGLFQPFATGNCHHRGSIVFLSKARSQGASWPGTSSNFNTALDISGSDYLTYEHLPTTNAAADPVLTGDVYSVLLGDVRLNALRLYKTKLLTDGTYHHGIISRGMSGTAAADYTVDFYSTTYAGDSRFKSLYGSATSARYLEMFHYNALKRRMYFKYEEDPYVHVFTLNHGISGPWSGVNASDAHRGTHNGGGHLVSWWLAGANRYKHVAYEHSLVFPNVSHRSHVSHRLQNRFHIEIDPSNGNEKALVVTSNGDKDDGMISYHPWVENTHGDHKKYAMTTITSY